MSDLNYFVAGRINTTPLDFNGNLKKFSYFVKKPKKMLINYSFYQNYVSQVTAVVTCLITLNF